MSLMSKLMKLTLDAVSVLPTGRLRWNHQPMVLLDKWSHKLKVPKRYQSPICDAFDKWIGIDDDSDIEFDEDYTERDCS